MRDLGTRPRLPHVLAVGALLGTALVYFRSGLFLGTHTILWDAADFHYPFLDYAARLWRSGQVPLWNPFLFNGFPFVADPESQVFYPVNLLGALVTEFTPQAVYAQIVVHAALSGLFTYLLAGLYVESLAARLLAGLCVTFSGVVVSHFSHLAIIDTAAWLPLVLFCLEKAFRGRAPLYVALGAGALAMAILAGHPQTYTYIVWTAALWTLLAALRAGRGNLRRALRPAGLFAAVLAGGVLLAAVQLVPTFELVRLSNRSVQVPFWYAAASGQITPSELITLLLPDYFGSVRGPFIGEGNISHVSIHFGVLPLLLALIGFAGKIRRPMVEFTVLALFALLFSMGEYGLIFKPMFDFAPGIGKFRSPAHFRFVFVLHAALLAACGLDALLKDELRLRRLLGLLGGLVLAGAAMIWLAGWPDPRVAGNVRHDLLVLGAVAALVLVAVPLRRKRLVPASALGLALAAAAYAELHAAGSNATTLGEKGHHGVYDEREGAFLRALSGDLPAGSLVLDPDELDRPLRRVHINAAMYSTASPVPDATSLGAVGLNRAMLYKVFLTDGWNPLMLQRHFDFSLHMRGKIQRPLLGLLPAAPVDEVQAMARWLALQNVEIVLTRKDGQLLALQLEGWLPRVYFAEEAVWAADAEAALGLLDQPDFQLGRQVVLEAEAGTPPDSAAPAGAVAEDGAGSVRLTRYLPDELAVEVDAGRPGFVVFADSYYPGWQATLDARPVEVLRANYLFKAVAVGPGRHEVVFRFRPRSLLLGAAVSGSTIVLGGLALVLALRRARQGGTGPRSGDTANG